jgi:hypothetical protein
MDVSSDSKSLPARGTINASDSSLIRGLLSADAMCKLPSPVLVPRRTVGSDSGFLSASLARNRCQDAAADCGNRIMHENTLLLDANIAERF